MAKDIEDNKVTPGDSADKYPVAPKPRRSPKLKPESLDPNAAVVKSDAASVRETSPVADVARSTSDESKAVSDTPANDISETADATPARRKVFNVGGNPKRLATGIAAAVVAILALTALVFGVLIYAYRSESPTVAAVAKVVPYPVARVNGAFVSYSDYLFQLNANERGYQQNAKLNNQPAVNYKSAEGKKIMAQFRKASLDKVKSDAVVAQLAKQKKVVVTDKDMDKLIGELYKNYGGKDTLLKTLKDIYGWNLSDLKKVVRKQLLEQKLAEKVTADPAIDAQAKAKAADVAAKAKDNGDFGALAKQYSQASDAAAGGDLGSFTKGQVSEEIQKAVDGLDVNGVSSPFKDKYGYEVVKVTEKSGDSTKASHILIKTVDFTD